MWKREDKLIDWLIAAPTEEVIAFLECFIRHYRSSVPSQSSPPSLDLQPCQQCVIKANPSPPTVSNWSNWRSDSIFMVVESWCIHSCKWNFQHFSSLAFSTRNKQLTGCRKALCWRILFSVQLLSHFQKQKPTVRRETLNKSRVDT